MQLKEWRTRENLTGEQAAERLSLSQPTISRIETGKLWPNRDTMEKIQVGTAGAVTPNDFLAANGDKSNAEAAA